MPVALDTRPGHVDGTGQADGAGEGPELCCKETAPGPSFLVGSVSWYISFPSNVPKLTSRQAALCRFRLT